jgi:hypothetical protein
MAKIAVTTPYYVTICVLFEKPVALEADSRLPNTLHGYYRNFGLSAANRDEAQSLVETEVQEGAIQWDDCQWEDIENLAPEIRQKIAPYSEPGVWHRSSSMFF